ncbi:hypothetical protein ACTFIR_006346 [Dictyostelium discoideum]
MKILFVLLFFFIFGFKQLTYCQVVCNGWIDSDSQVITTPCGENTGNPCQTIDLAVETCGNYDTINLYFTQTTKPFIISENGSFNSINNKTITLNNINNNNQPILIDLSNTTKPFINIIPNENNNSNLTNTISINGFTFSNQTIQSSSSIIKMVNSNLNMNINNCNFLNNILGKNGLFYFSSDPNVKNSNVGSISIVNSNFINNVGNDNSIIYSDYDSHIIIDKCLFKNISSNNEGAVLDLEKGFTTITNSLFQNILLNNTSGANVIFLGTPYPSNDNYLITFDNITISDSFTGYGIVITSQYYTININNSKFINNYNFLSIGVFNSIITDININNCIFQDNSNLNSNILAKGGAISLINSAANISNSIFNSNTGNLGGAIYIVSKGTLLSNPIVIIGCTFIDCKGTVDDGDSIFINGSTLVEITNSTFTQSTQQKSNQPKNSQVYCQSTSLLLSSLKFINQSNSDELLTCFNNSNCKITEKSDKQYYNSCNPPNGKNDSDDDSNNNDEQNHRRLSPLQIFGIVVGSIIVLIIIFLIVVLIYIKVKRNRHYIPIK